MEQLPPREPRTTVRLTVRIRADGGWSDATVHNVSQRGMMVRSLYPLRRNQYVEIARGHTRVVGRIVWTADAGCGLRAQDAIDIGALLGQPAATRAALRDGRREPPRTATGSFGALALSNRADSSRRIAQGFEFIAVIAVVAASAVLAIDATLDAAGTPLAQVRIALAP